jgi:hypothetical protein
MKWDDFIGPTYNSRIGNVGIDRCINLYPEFEPATQTDRKPKALLNTPGLVLYDNTLGSTVIRGMHQASGILFIVAGNQLYAINYPGIPTAISGATLTTSTGRVSIVDNGVPFTTGADQICIADGTCVYIYNYAAGVFTGTWTNETTANPSLISDMVVYINGYFIVNVKPNYLSYAQEFWVSNLYDGTTWNPLNVSSADATPGYLLSIMVSNLLVYFFKSNSVEIWYDSGQGYPPFARVPGVLIEEGLAAQWSVAKSSIDSSLYGLFGGNTGLAYAVNISGYTPTRISTPAVEYQWSQYTTVHDAWGYCYTMEGHDFYVITFPTGNATWAYDKTINMWHERSKSFTTTMPVTASRHVGNIYEYYPATLSANTVGYHLLADYSNGNIYYMSNTVYQDNGGPISRLRVTPHIIDDRKNIFVSSLELDMQTGITSGATCSLQWSKDGGVTWSGQFTVGMGVSLGALTRVIWRKLGRARDRVFAWSTTANAPIGITGAIIKSVGER